MAGKRVLEIKEAEVAAAGNDHQIVRMIVAQHQHRIILNDLKQIAPSLSPGAEISFRVDLQPKRRGVPFGKQGHLARHCDIVIGWQIRRRRLRGDTGEDVNCDLIDVPLAVGFTLQQRADPVVTEILEQQQALLPIDCQRSRRREAAVEKMPGDGEKRPDILMLGRRVHQHRRPVPAMDTKIAAKAGIARERTDLRPLPAMRGEKGRRIRWRNHRGGHRAPQAGGT
jgi:hypothetical protein